MKRTLFVLALVCVARSAVSPILACGDKFLLPVRGSRFQQAPALRQPASVLLFANPASALPASISRLSVDSALRKVGYRPTIVASAEAFDRAINQATWDVVVIDIHDRAALPSRLQGRATTVVLPIAANATKAEFTAARKDFPHLLKSPSRSQAFVDAIDEALATRPAGGGQR